MSFIKKIKGPDEKLLGIAYIHWIYGLQGLLWLAGLMFFGLFVNNFSGRLFSGFRDNPAFDTLSNFGDAIFWICTGIGVILFMFYVLMIATTEVGLTDKRVIFKRGFLFVKTVEVDIEEIKGANVNNGIFGRILNYGYILLDARFVENLSLPAVADPYRFVKALNEMRSKLKQDSMQIVIEGAVGGEPGVKPQQQKPRQQDDDVSKKSKPTHLYDDRYKALSNDPLEAVAGLVDDTTEDIEQASHAIHKQAHHSQSKTTHEIDPQTSQPIKIPRGLFSKKQKQAQDGGDLLYKKPSKKLRPIIFRQERLREDIKDSFSENTAP